MARFERVAVAALGFCAAAACNSIAGLGQFQDVPCEPCDTGLPFDGAADGPIPEGAAPLEAAVDTGTDDVADVAVDTGIDAADTGPGGFTSSEGGSSVDFRWPLWRMPNGAEAGLPNPASYALVPGTDAGEFDNITKLSWGNAQTGISQIATATSACGPPWRLPTRIELVSILDTSRSPVLVNPVFTSIQRFPYWTSSVTPTGTPWTVDFNSGTVAPTGAGEAVICIYVGDDAGAQ